MSWIDKILPSGVNKDESANRTSVPEGLWKKCVKCDAILYKPDLERSAEVCPKCDHHMRIGARRRLELCLDRGATELFADLEPVDHLRFKDKRKYRDRLTAAQRSTGEKDALIAMRGSILGVEVVTLAFEFDFHGGSMGYAVGEKFTRAGTVALEEGLPLICFSASGGARMQEGMLSLMQMAKISGSLERHREAELLYMPLLTHPTTGGVTASFAMLGDLILAEPKALIGFAGRRVIEQTLREKLPDNFQTAEYLQEHGFVDTIVPRTQLRSTLANLLRLHGCKPMELTSA